MKTLACLAVLLLALPLCGQSGPAIEVPVCSVVSNPKKYTGERIAVRGLLLFVIGDAAPPSLLKGDCVRGIALIGEKSARGSAPLLRAEMEPRPTSPDVKRIWATFSGTLRVDRIGAYMSVDRVSHVVVLPNLAIRSAQVPVFQEEADWQPGRLRIALTIRHGNVIAAHILGKSTSPLARASLLNVRTWRFSPELDAKVTTVFDFRVAAAPACPPSNPQVVLRLPESVIVTRWKNLPCDTTAGSAPKGTGGGDP